MAKPSTAKSPSMIISTLLFFGLLMASIDKTGTSLSLVSNNKFKFL